MNRMSSVTLRVTRLSLSGQTESLSQELGPSRVTRAPPSRKHYSLEPWGPGVSGIPYSQFLK